ncbi:unknown [Bacteroides cellulosilyticus CAG:158]|nr:unknown [Bacteroides cellulosilyticus CAG:158]
MGSVSVREDEMFEKAIEIILIIVSYIPEYCLKIPCPRRLIDGIYNLFKTIGDYFIYGPLFGGKVGKLFRMFIVILSVFFFYEIIHIHQKFRCGTGAAEHTRYDKYHIDESSAERLQIGGCRGVTAYGCGSADQPRIHGDACAIIGKIGFIILIYEVLVQQFDVAV